MTTALATRNDEGLDKYMAEASRHPLLNRAQELELAKRYHDEGDVVAAHELVVANLRFVVKVAHEYAGYGLKLLDLVQEGNVGLMVAVKKFDPYKGYRLISYAVWWIRAQIQSFIMRSWSMVRMGASRIHRKLFFKLRSQRSLAERENGGQAVSTEALAQRLEVSEDAAADMEARLAARDFSLDAKLGDESGAASHLDMLADDVDRNQEDELGDRQEQALLQGFVQDALETLNDKERYIVEKRLLSDEPETLQQIGDTFSVSRERVRQLETRVLSKLRKVLTPVMAASAA